MGEMSLLSRIVGRLSRSCEHVGERLKVLLRSGRDGRGDGPGGAPAAVRGGSA